MSKEYWWIEVGGRVEIAEIQGIEDEVTFVYIPGNEDHWDLDEVKLLERIPTYSPPQVAP